LWKTRLHIAIGGIEGALDAVRVGAALGLRVHQDVWHRACRELGLSPPGDLGDAMARNGLADWGRTHWRMSHPMLREVIVADGRSDSDWTRICAACATAILAMPVDAADAGAVADLLVDAGQPRRASPHYERHAEYLRHTGDLTGCRAVLARWEDALTDAALPANDVRWGRLWCRRAATLAHTDVTAGLALARRGLDACLRHSWGEIEALCRRTVGSLAGNHGDLEAAVAELAQGVEAAERCDDDAELAATMVVHAELLRRVNRYDESLALFSRCASMSLPDTPSRAKMFVLAANTLSDTGNRDRAVAYLDEADRILARMPAEHVQLQATFTRGEIARSERRLEDAKVAYRRCLRGFAERGAARWVLAMRMNLALCCIAQGRTEPARGWLEGCEDYVHDGETLADTLASTLAAANLGHDDAATDHWRQRARTLRGVRHRQNPVLEQMLTWAAENSAPEMATALRELASLSS
jgi:tetratricopeptide (TPR) repeat protein